MSSVGDWSKAPRRWLLAVALAGTVVALYAPTLSHGFVNWDDDVLVVQNPAVTSPSGLRRIWSTVELPAHFPNYPLVFTSFWIEHALWGMLPGGYHATNVLLHALNSVLVLLLVEALTAPTWVALLTAALFAAHPMQVESVAWVAERKNVLSASFYLLAALAYVRYRAAHRRSWYLLSLVLFLAALLSKTATVILPLSLALADWCYFRRRPIEIARAIVPMLALAVLAAGLTLTVESHPPSTPLLARPLLAATAVWFYAAKLLVPISLLPIYPRWEISLGAWQWWLPLLSLMAVLLCIGRWSSDRHVRWGVGHFVCALLPVLGLVSYGFNEMSYVGDRHVYLASIGLCLAFAAVTQHLDRRRLVVLAPLAALWLIALATLTRHQIDTWRNSETLWTVAVTGNPGAWIAHNNLALVYIDQERFRDATQHLETALRLNPGYPEAHNNLALVRYRQQDFAGAAEHCRKAVALKPDAATYHKNLSLALAAGGDAAGAEAALARAIELAPEASLHALMASWIANRGQLDEAATHYQQALALDPTLDEVRNQLGRTLLALDRLPEAVAVFTQLVHAHPDWPEGRYNLSLALQGLGRRDEAAHELTVALALRPEFEAARDALAAMNAPLVTPAQTGIPDRPAR